MWSFYEFDTGRFTGQTFQGRQKYLALNTPAGCAAIAGVYDHECFAVDESGDVYALPMSEARMDRDARNQRQALLNSCDWTQVADADLSKSKLADWRAYRQALRDITDQPGFPSEIDWPIPPA